MARDRGRPTRARRLHPRAVHGGPAVRAGPPPRTPGRPPDAGRTPGVRGGGVNRRQAARLAAEDNTPYTVERRNAAGQPTARYRVTGYPSARAIAGRDPHTVILT